MEPITWVAIAFGIAGLFFVASFGVACSFLGNSDHWNDIAQKAGAMIGLSCAGTLVFAVSSYFFFSIEPKYSQYFMIITSSLALGLAYTAIVISAMSK